MGTKTQTIDIESATDSSLTLDQMIKEFQGVLTELEAAKENGYINAGSNYKIKLYFRKDFGEKPPSFNSGGGKD